MDRHPQDSRILVIENFEDFKLWHQRYQLGISGIVCDYPIDAKTLNDSAKHVADLARKNKWDESYQKYDNVGVGRTKEFSITAKTSVASQLMDSGINQQTSAIITDVTNCFKRATGLSDRRFWQRDIEAPDPLKVKVNSMSTNFYHKDYGYRNATLVFAFSKGGALCSSHDGHYKDDITPESEYAIETGQIALFDDTVWHKTDDPDPEEDRIEDPRVVLVI